MNTLEDRLREALGDRAAYSPIDPDAWEKTVARSRRFRLGLPRWLPAGVVIPAAAATAVIAIVVAAMTLTGATRTGSHNLGTNAAGGTSTTPPPPGTPRQVSDVLHTHPAVSSIVSAKVGANQVYVWFSHPRDNYLCFVVVGDATAGGYICNRWSVGVPAKQVLNIATVPPVNSGNAVDQATSVTAQLTDRSSAPAVIVSGRGFPFKVWFASVPPGYGAQLVFRNAAGHEIATEDVPAEVATRPQIPGSGGILVNDWTAYLVNGKVLWHGPDNGAIVPLPWTVKQKPLMVIFQATTKVNYALGYAPAEVARLKLRFPNGTTYEGPTVPAWPGSGERLWVRTGLPWSGLPPQTLVVSYNASGKVIAQQTPASLFGS